MRVVSIPIWAAIIISAKTKPEAQAITIITVAMMMTAAVIAAMSMTAEMAATPANATSRGTIAFYNDYPVFLEAWFVPASCRR